MARTGFASMDPEKARAIRSQGGKAAHHASTKCHEWTSETAKIAGRKGGRVSQRNHRIDQELAMLDAVIAAERSHR